MKERNYSVIETDTNTKNSAFKPQQITEVSSLQIINFLVVQLLVFCSINLENACSQKYYKKQLIIRMILMFVHVLDIIVWFFLVKICAIFNRRLFFIKVYNLKLYLRNHKSWTDSYRAPHVIFSKLYFMGIISFLRNMFLSLEKVFL